MKKALWLTVALAISAAAWGDQSGTATLKPHACLNLDTGAAACTGADLVWDGATLTAQGGAALYNLGKYGSRVFRAIHARSAASAHYGSEPIPASALVAGEIFGVRTNLGHYAKVIVTGAAAGSIAVEYTTFLPAIRAAASSGPVITQLQNNYSYILPGLPNYGIAPGSIFVIIGTGLSSSAPPVLQSSAPPGLLTTLNQTSVAVTVNGVTTTPALYYTSANQLAAVLPSNTPAGTGTITVTYNGQPSAAAPIRVVANAPGLDTLYGTGNGAGVATDTSGNVLGLTHSAMPNQIITLWGSGIGADPNNDDRIFPQKQNNLTSIPTQVFIGGVSAAIGYSGRSQYPGLDQYNVTIPANVTPGCFVSAVVQAGTVMSNTVMIPVSATGGVCTDPGTGLTGTQIQSLANIPGNSANSLVVAMGQTHLPDRNYSSALALGGGLLSSIYGMGYEYASQGSCTVVPPGQGQFGQPGPFGNVIQAALDAGTIQVTGPGGNLNLGSGPGIYYSQFSALAPAGTYTFTASGGHDIGKFSVALNSQLSLNVTNQSALATVTRSQGATVTWSGGISGGTVMVEGDVGGPFGTVRSFCFAPGSAGQLTIPSSVLLALAPGGGEIIVMSTTAPQTVSPTGVSLGLALGVETTKFDTVFK